MKRTILAISLAMGLSGCISDYTDPYPAPLYTQTYQPSIVTPSLAGVANEQSSASAVGAAPVSAPAVSAAQPCVGICYGVTSPITGRPRNTYVRGYTRRDGTYVRPYTRSRRN